MNFAGVTRRSHFLHRGAISIPHYRLLPEDIRRRLFPNLAPRCLYVLESLGMLAPNAKNGGDSRRVARGVPSRELPLFLAHIRCCVEVACVAASFINATRRLKRVG